MMPVLQTLRQLRSRSKWLVIGSRLYHNYRTGVRYRQGDYATFDGTAHIGLDLSQSLHYIDRVYGDYIHYGGIEEGMLDGREVLELGPGDNLGVALKFLTAGARRVTCLDKFHPRRNESQQLAIYRALREATPEALRPRFDDAVELSEPVRFNPERIRYVSGAGIETAATLFEPESFDFIVSCAVLMQIPPIDAALDVMHRLLAPGGYLLHKIDMRDFALFTHPRFHPLEFLTLPEALYRHLISNVGYPTNRKFCDYYRRKMEEYGYSAKIFAAEVLGRKEQLRPFKLELEYGVDYTDFNLDLIRSIRPRLHPPFHKMSDRDLLVAGIFLAACKPRP